MNKILTVKIGALVLVASLVLASCENKTPLEEKKKQLADLKGQQDKLNKQVNSLQSEIDKLDTANAVKEKTKLVALTTLTPTSFTHYIDLQGDVEAVNTSYISPRGTGGVVKELYVRQGDHVSQGQLLMKLDDALQRQQVTSAQTQLAYAKDLYQRRKNLWDQKIGMEVDLVNAKNQVDQAETQLKIAQEQQGFTSVYADIPGTVNSLTIKVGESFAPGSQAVQIVNTDNLKVVVQVPEIYQQRVKVGTPVRISFPGLNNKVITGTVHIAGKVINTSNRAFQVEIHIPNSSDIRANQVAVIKLQDYTASNVLTIPVNTLQTDEKGKYVMVAEQEKGKLVAHKKVITIGQTYSDKIEVSDGLQTGEKLITDGFQGLYEGQVLTIQ